MYKRKIKTQKRLMYFALSMLAFVALAIMFIAPVEGIALTSLALVPIWGVVKDKTFKELTVEDVAKLSQEDQVSYFNELNAFKAEQLKEYKKQLKDETDATIKDQINKSIADLRDEILEGVKEQATTLRTQGIAITKLLKGSEVKTNPNTIKEEVTKNFDDISKVETGGSFKFKIKNAIRKTTVSLASITSDPNGMFLPGWAEIQTQANRLAPSLGSFALTADDHGVIRWVDQTTRTNNAAARSDGGAAAEQVYAWTGYSETVDNVSAMVPVHKEALKHITMMEQEINRLLTEDVAEALDDYCYTGTGNAPQIGGIFARATAFDAAAYVAAGGATPKSANLYDLGVSMAGQIMKESKYIVDRMWVNPYDAIKMKLTKDENGVYVMPPFVVPGANGMITVSGMQVIEANSVTANTCVVGDSRKAVLYSTGTAEIEVGYNLTGDFSKRILTILANLEASLLIRNAEVDAFLKSTDIVTDVAAIELPTD